MEAGAEVGKGRRQRDCKEVILARDGERLDSRRNRAEGTNLRNVIYLVLLNFLFWKQTDTQIERLV